MSDMDPLHTGTKEDETAAGTKAADYFLSALAFPWGLAGPITVTSSAQTFE